MKTSRAIVLFSAFLLLNILLTSCATAPQSTSSQSVLSQPDNSPADNALLALQWPILSAFQFFGGR
jgi:hypothetical protein